jgi:predicted nuclease of predicted toxin-antitoxin system
VKFLLDQGMPLRAAALLRESAIDAVHASEVGLSSAADRDILDWCRDHAAIAVTLDADFHSLIALSGQAGPSAIRIRRQGLKGPETARLLGEIVTAHAEPLAAGVLISVESTRIRLRRLPIAPISR